MENTLPRWSARADASRPLSNPGFTDLIPIVAHHYRLHSQAYDFLGPYNAKQRVPNKVYISPTKDQLRMAVKQGRVNDMTYFSFINALEKYCEMTKGTRALPTPHPSTIHSIQLPHSAFNLSQDEKQNTIMNIIGVEVPLILKNVKPADFRFAIVRPKLSKLGTASVSNWEVLLFREAFGYIVDWADSNLNPRWSGVYS